MGTTVYKYILETTVNKYEVHFLMWALKEMLWITDLFFIQFLPYYSPQLSHPLHFNSDIPYSPPPLPSNHPSQLPFHPFPTPISHI